MPKLPPRYAAYAYGIIQAALTTGIATAVAALRSRATGAEAVATWLATWGLSWVAMLPVVVGLSPAIRRAVEALVAVDDSGTAASDPPSPPHMSRIGGSERSGQ